MRRTTRRILTQLCTFLTILFLIIFLGGSSSSTHHKTYAWNTIRYKTTATTTPPSRGACPELSSSLETTKPALVVARVTDDGDPNWLSPLRDSYSLCIYTADAPATTSPNLQVPANRGHEAMAYLTFLIDNYATVPAAGVVFIHGSRWAWHNDERDYDNLALLSQLNVSAALEPHGYHNLRCDWSAGTCSRSLAPQGSLESSMNAVLQPWSARAVSDAALPKALGTLFGGGDGKVVLGRAEAVRAQCCAQFAVSREQIWRHSRAEYVALRQWLLDGSSGGGGGGGDLIVGDGGDVWRGSGAPADDRVAGRILSYVWHILFTAAPGRDGGVDLGRLNERACPSAKECYCRLYGRCGLEGCEEGRCFGQYDLPQNFKLPDDWAATHG